MGTSWDFDPNLLTDIEADLVKGASQVYLDYIQESKKVGESTPGPAVTASEWLQQLANMDASSDSTMHDFMIKTYLGNVEKISLGSHGGIPYFLQPGSDSIPQRSTISLTPLDRMRGTSEYVKSYEYEILPTDDIGGPRPDLRYGFGLGVVKHMPKGEVGENQSDDDLKDTGFFVVYNVIDRSVWITVDYSPFTNAATEFRAEPLPAAWGIVPEDDSLQIGTMRISQQEWWKKSAPMITFGDPFSVFPPCNWKLVGKPAVISEYLQWLPS